MQTFLPYNHMRSTSYLDYKRLGKQRPEANTILKILNGTTPGSAWKNHPAVKMWEGHHKALEVYLRYCALLWEDRGYKNNQVYGKDNFLLYPQDYPWWWNNPLIYISHRSNLVRKWPEFYSKYGWKDYGIEGYYWPVILRTKKARKAKVEWVKLYYNGVLSTEPEILGRGVQD